MGWYFIREWVGFWRIRGRCCGDRFLVVVVVIG